MFSRYGRPGGSDRQEKGNYLRNIFGLMQALDETGRLNDLAYLAE
jgi:hypothetical protein